MEKYKVSWLRFQGLWAKTAFERSEMALEGLVRECEDGQKVVIIVDEPIPGSGRKGLEEFLIKRGASEVIFDEE